MMERFRWSSWLCRNFTSPRCVERPVPSFGLKQPAEGPTTIAAGFGGCVVGAVALLLLPGSPALAAATHRPAKPAVATLPAGTNDMLISVTGPGFGSPGPASALQIVINQGRGERRNRALD
jgi:hypothetical protein